VRLCEHNRRIWRDADHHTCLECGSHLVRSDNPEVWEIEGPTRDSEASESRPSRSSRRSR